MLLDLRETIRNSKPIKYSLIALICIPFALVGVGSYFAGGSAAPVALVNGEPIDEQSLEAAYRQQRQRFSEMFGGQIPAGFDDETLLRQQALDQLVTQRVLVEEVAAQRFAVGDETLARAIRQRPEFQTDGQFDAERYRQLLGGSSSSQVTAFEAQYRDETALDQFRAGVVDTAFTLPSEAERLDTLARQERTIDALRYDLAAAQEQISISDDDVVARFDEAPDSYTFPPRAKLAWLELSAASLAANLDVSEDDAREWYEANRATFMTPESRSASHILFTVDDAEDEDAVAQARSKAEAAAARLAAGEDFAALATELSEDAGSAPGGGSLGTISAGLMVPAFEDALNALGAEGDVTEPVVSEFGVHLIKLDGLTPESGRSFEDAREEVMASAATDAADREYFELRELLAELAFDNPESLEAASEATGLTIQTSDWVEQSGGAGPQADPVLSAPAVIQAAFSADVLEDGNNSEPIEIGERQVVVVRVTDDEGPRPKTLDDVREQLSAELTAERAAELLAEKADVAAAALAEGGAVAALAEQEPLATALEGEVVTRQSTGFDRAAIATLFGAAAPAEGAPSSGVLTLQSGDLLAWNLLSISTPDLVMADATDVSVSGAEAPLPAGPGSGADPRLGTVEFGAMLESLRSRADVDLEP